MATLKAMFKLFDGYSTTIDKIERKTKQATDKIVQASGSTDKFNQKLKETGASSERASKGLGSFIGKAALLAGAIKGMGISDTLVNTQSRLSLINDDLQTQAELQEKIFASATRSRGAYTSMAAAIAKLGLNAGDSFSSNDELIGFTELIQKGFKVGGASSEEQSNAMLQLTQAMGSGKLQGDEFRSIMENAPMIADAIAKYVGIGKGELKELSSEGAITSDIIKNAIFAAGDDINAKFQTMPITFGDVWNKIKNGALSAFEPISTAVSNLINTTGFMNFVNAFIIGINVLGAALGGLIDFVIAGWDLISPFIISLATVWLVGIISKLWAMIPPILIQAAAWAMANAPMLLMIALIVVIAQTLASLGVTFEDVFSFVGGLLGVFYASFYNYFVSIWNTVAAFINFFGNVFTNPIASVQTLFYNMAVNVLGFIESMAQGIEDLINKIPGVNVTITSGITNLKNNLAAKSASIKDEAGLIDFVKSKEFMNYSGAATTGSSLGKDAYGSVSGAISGLTNSLSSLTTGMTSGGTTGLLGLEGLGSGLGTAFDPVTVDGTGKNAAVDVNMADEDLKYMRDIAEREYINKFSTKTLAPQITVTFGDVKETADVDQVAKRISKILKEEIETTGEGVA